jgi:ribosomal protein L24
MIYSNINTGDHVEFYWGKDHWEQGKVVNVNKAGGKDVEVASGKIYNLGPAHEIRLAETKTINENLEPNDLARLISHKIHIDEYKSKMGDDADICVISFQVTGKEPAADLVNFIEKGYNWVLDADASSGEKENGKYLVFVETPRSDDLPEQIVELTSDISNLVEFDEWKMQYHKSIKKVPVTEKNIKDLVPLSAEAYDVKFDKKPIDDLKAAADIDIDTTAPINDMTESLRIAAGIK